MWRCAPHELAAKKRQVFNKKAYVPFPFSIVSRVDHTFVDERGFPGALNECVGFSFFKCSESGRGVRGSLVMHVYWEILLISITSLMMST